MKLTSKKELARKLGGDVNGPWINIRGPGHSSADRSLGIIVDPKAPGGLRVNSFADDNSACRTYVEGLLAKISAGDTLIVKAEVDHDRALRITRARRIWNESSPLTGSLAHRYLHARGCGSLPEDVSNALRFHPQCPFGSDCYPALIAAMRDVATGEIIGIHRTAISDDGGGKRPMPDGSSPKRMIGSPVGAAVMLDGDVGAHLGIAEGIETALSAAKIFKMPVWSALSARGIAAFPIIRGITSLCVFADHDKAGISAAAQCGRRYAEAGIDVDVRYPRVAGSDWNDYLMKETSSAD